jgi:hypothetical protein
VKRECEVMPLIVEAWTVPEAGQAVSAGKAGMRVTCLADRSFRTAPPLRATAVTGPPRMIRSALPSIYLSSICGPPRSAVLRALQGAVHAA